MKFSKCQMDCSSLREEKNSFETSNCLLIKDYLNKQFCIHYYNTRFSKKLKIFKELYVDLTKSNILSKKDNNNIQSNLRENSKSTCCRRGSTTSLDSAEFDSRDCVPKTSVYYKMNQPRRICLDGRPQNNWHKYFYGLCLLGSLYIIILVLHHGEQIQKIVKDVQHLKQQVIDSIDTETRLYRMETSLNNIKREQESLRKNLRYLVATELEKFGADKTGKADFALETSGGRIVRLSADTKNFNYAKTLFGITLCEGIHGPRAMLQPDMSPGHCWAIKGSNGGAIIKLIGKVLLQAVTIEHISENMSPTSEVSSAPKDFEVWGLKDAVEKGDRLGRFTYELNEKLVQTFPIDNYKYYEYVEFKVLTNHNNPDFTCVYRFRVHGILGKDEV